MPKKKNPGTILPLPLSRELVLLAAPRLADAEGLEALDLLRECIAVAKQVELWNPRFAGVPQPKLSQPPWRLL